MRIAYRDYHCVRGWNALGRIPGLRELFINDVNCLLDLPARSNVNHVEAAASVPPCRARSR